MTKNSNPEIVACAYCDDEVDQTVAAMYSVGAAHVCEQCILDSGLEGYMYG
jgi:hypothetical protein